MYNFHIHSNDGIYLEIGDQVLFNQLTSIIDEGDTLTITSSQILLKANEFVPIKVKYYDVTGSAFVSLMWSSPSVTLEIIPETSYYTVFDEVTIQGVILQQRSNYKPAKVWNLRQGDEATYADDSITVLWDSPLDTGCEAITNYVVSY